MGLTAPAAALIRLCLMAGCSERLQARRGHRLLQHLHTLSAGANPPFQTWGILPLCPSTSPKPPSQKLRSHAPAAPSPMLPTPRAQHLRLRSRLGLAVLPPSLRIASVPLPARPAVAGVTGAAGRACCHPAGTNPEETPGGLGCTERPPFRSSSVEPKSSKTRLT